MRHASLSLLQYSLGLGDAEALGVHRGKSTFLRREHAVLGLKSLTVALRIERGVGWGVRARDASPDSHSKWSTTEQAQPRPTYLPRLHIQYAARPHLREAEEPTIRFAVEEFELPCNALANPFVDLKAVSTL